jgi:hypothetical protein
MGRKKKIQDEGLPVWQPKGFNPLAHLPPDLHRYADYARFYLGLVIHLTSLRDEEDLGFGVQLSFDFAQRFFPGTEVYKQVKDALLAHRALECDGKYEVGVRAMAYRLGEAYQGGGLEKIRIKGKACRLLDKKLRSWHEESMSGLNEVHRHLLRWVREVRIGRYAQTALDETLDSYPMDLVQHDNIKSLSRPSRSLANPLKKCNYGRVHTPVSYGWKGFRYHLTINGARLAGIDMRNSQPLLFGLVLSALHQNGGRIPTWLAPATEDRDVGYLELSQAVNTQRADENVKHEESPTTHKDTQKLPIEKKMDQGGGENPFIMTELSGHDSGPRLTEVLVEQRDCAVTSNNVYLKGEGTKEVFYASPVEIQRYVELCEAGQFYDQLLKQLDDPSVDRSEFKVRMFRNVFFGKDEDCKYTPEWKHFAAEFPTIAGVIRGLKRRYGNGAVAWLLMRVESSLMIDRICRRLMVEAPDVPVVTIHDMILTTSKNCRRVEQVVREEYARVGLQATLNNEDYGQQPPPKRTPKPKRRRRRRHDPD